MSELMSFIFVHNLVFLDRDKLMKRDMLTNFIKNVNKKHTHTLYLYTYTDGT